MMSKKKSELLHSTDIDVWLGAGYIKRVLTQAGSWRSKPNVQMSQQWRAPASSASTLLFKLGPSLGIKEQLFCLLGTN